MATLLASAWLSDSPAGTTPPSALYTVGSPRVGDAAFVATLSKVANTRYVDCCDGVTRVPLEVMGYEHVGRPSIHRPQRQDNGKPGRRFHPQRTGSAPWKSISCKYFWKSGNVGARELADHAPINYVSAVMGIRA